MSFKEHYNKEKLYGSNFAMAIFIAIILAVMFFSKLIPLFGAPIGGLAFLIGAVFLFMAIAMNLKIANKLDTDTATRSAFAGMKPAFSDYLDVVIGIAIAGAGLALFASLTMFILGGVYIVYAVTTIITKEKASKVSNG